MKLPRFSIDDETRRTIDETKNKAMLHADRAMRVTDRLLQPRLVLPLFAALLVLLVLVSGVVLIREHNKPTADSGNTSESSSETQPADLAKGTLQANFLLVFADNNTGTLRMLAVVHADSEQNALSVRYVSPSDRVNVNNLNGSMQQHYDKGGATELSWAVGTYMDQTMDRYVMVNNDRFIIFCKTLGEHELLISPAVQTEYDGVAFVIKEGKQKLTSDMLCKYFGYCCQTLYTGGDAKVSELLEYLIQKLLADENSTRFDQILAKLVSGATTNLSAMDLQAYSAVRAAFCKDGAPAALTNEGVFRPGEAVEN